MKTGDDRKSGLLRGVKVLDVGEGVSGPYAARTLAWLGADVVKVEPPDGDVSRRMGPFPDNIPHAEKSASVSGAECGEARGHAGPGIGRGRERFLELAAESQVVVDNHPSGWLSERGIGYEELAAVREDIICAR